MHLLQIRYLGEYPNPIIQLDDKAIGLVLGPGEGDALMNLLFVAARMDPSDFLVVPRDTAGPAG